MKVIEQYRDAVTRETFRIEVDYPDVITEAAGIARDAAAQVEATERARMAFLRTKILEAMLGNDGVTQADRIEYRQLRTKYGAG